MNDIFEQLNPAQCDAVRYIEGPELVIAGAGAGKTRVLTYKIAYLLQNGYKPWEILALTFTNKAAKEMKERIGCLVGTEMSRYLQMGTFHSLFSRILRIEAEAIGFSSDYTIYDESDSCSLIKSIVKELELNDKVYKASAVHKNISLAKNNLCLPADYVNDAAYRERDERQGLAETHTIYRIYSQRLRQADAMDFDDILLFTQILLKNNPDTLRKYAERFRYILVDEYQDTNVVQQDIVRLLASVHGKVCVVGDDAQSIYAFRGANIYNVLHFEKVFSHLTKEERKVKVFKLEQNYRSTQNIVNAANSLIHCNKHQIHKEVFSENSEGEKIRIQKCYSDREEAILVSNDIRLMKRRYDMCNSDFAILYRTNVQSRILEEQLRKDMIAYHIVGGLSFYQHKEIKDITSYIRLIVNHNDTEAFKRVVNYPARGIGKVTLEKIMALASQHEVSPWQVLQQPAVFGLSLSKSTMSKVCGFVDIITALSEKKEAVDAYELIEEMLELTGINEDIFGKKDFEDIRRQENVQEFKNGVAEFVGIRREEEGAEGITLSRYLQEIALMTDLDSEDVTDDRVTLMTVHAAKGLEFPAVYVVGLDEGIFPSERSESPAAVEEERRLLYVAITRAERFCTLTSADKRSRFGEMENYEPSRFLRDIDSRYIERRGSGNTYSSSRAASYGSHTSERSQANGGKYPSRSISSSRSVSSPRSVPSSSSVSPSSSLPSGTFRRIPKSAASSVSATSYGEFSVGCTVEHERFGIGTVLELEGSGESSKAKVAFRNGAERMLLLKFARMKKI